MIEFQTAADPIFLAIFDDALEYVRTVQLGSFREGYKATEAEENELDELYANFLHPDLLPFFSRKELIGVIDRLLLASRARQLYRLTDYHWLVVYRCLEIFCDLHNDEDLGRDGQVGPYIIDKIDFDYIEGRFFFDIDFLFQGKLIVAEEHGLKRVPDLSSQARKIAAGVKPDLADLELTPINASESLAEPAGEQVVPKSGYVGPYPMRETQ